MLFIELLPNALLLLLNFRFALFLIQICHSCVCFDSSLNIVLEKAVIKQGVELLDHLIANLNLPIDQLSVVFVFFSFRNELVSEAEILLSLLFC